MTIHLSHALDRKKICRQPCCFENVYCTEFFTQFEKSISDVVHIR